MGEPASKSQGSNPQHDGSGVIIPPPLPWIKKHYKEGSIIVSFDIFAAVTDRIIQENSDATESRIRDTDMARETVIYSKYRLLEQVGQTLLAQANQNKMGILNLLQ